MCKWNLWKWKWKAWTWKAWKWKYENEKCEMKCQTAIRPQPRSSMKSTTEITYESETCYGKQHMTMSNGYKDTADSLMKEKHAKIRSV